MVTNMRKIIPVALALLGLTITLVSVPYAQAAGPAPSTSEVITRDGTIDLLKLDKGLIVIDDGEYRVSNQTNIHGRNGSSLLSLRKGMKVRFTYQPSPVRSEISEILILQ
jgi:hypothetical protein